MAIFIGSGIIFLSFFFSNTTVDTSLHSKFTMAYCLLLVIVVYGVIKQITSGKNRTSLPNAVIMYGMLGFFLFQFVGLLSSLNLDEGLFDFFSRSLLVLVPLLWFWVVKPGKKRPLLITKIVVLGVLIHGFIGLTQYLFSGVLVIPGSCTPYSTLSNKNIFVTWLLISLPFTILGQVRFSGIWKILSTLAFAMSLILIFISLCRSVWVGLLTAGFVSGFFMMYVRPPSGESKDAPLLKLKYLGIIASAALVISLLLNTFYHPSRLDPCDEQLSQSMPYRVSSLAYGEGTIQERLELWRGTLRMIKSFWLMGAGTGDWSVLYSVYKDKNEVPVKRNAFPARPHNDYLWIWAENGLFGLLSYLVLFGTILFRQVKNLQISRDRYSRDTSYVVVFGIIAFLVVSFFSYPLERIEVILLVGLLIAIAMENGSVKFYSFMPGITHLTNALLVVLVSSGIVIGTMRWTGDAETYKALKAKDGQDWESVLKYAQNGQNRFYSLDYSGTPIEFYKGIALFSMNRINSSINAFNAARKKNPYHVHVLNNLGTALVKKGRLVEAEEIYKQALEITPWFADAGANLGVVYHKQGKDSLALKVFTKMYREYGHQTAGEMMREKRKLMMKDRI